MKLKECLKRKGISDEELRELPSSYDMIGNIAIVEIKEGKEKYEKAIAECIMETHKRIKAVVKKATPVSGEYRTRKFEVILGEYGPEQIHAENGIRLKLHLEKVFFNPRMANERLRIAKLVKEGEFVLVPFAGVGPFAILIGKMHPTCEVIGIELNEIACRYFEENVHINKVKNVKVICGDAKEWLKKFEGKADRVVAPLPFSSHLFLEEILTACKKVATIHLYVFEEKENPKQKEIEREIEKKNIKVVSINRNVLKSYSPAIVEVVYDITIEKLDNNK